MINLPDAFRCEAPLATLRTTTAFFLKTLFASGRTKLRCSELICIDEMTSACFSRHASPLIACKKGFLGVCPNSFYIHSGMKSTLLKCPRTSRGAGSGAQRKTRRLTFRDCFPKRPEGVRLTTLGPYPIVGTAAVACGRCFRDTELHWRAYQFAHHEIR